MAKEILLNLLPAKYLMQKLRLIGWLLCLFCILSGAAVSQIISPERLFGRYQQFVWQDQHGLPQNGISRIAQTPDGYLWLAIAEGVARFDGVRFTAFDIGNTPEIKSNNVQSLLVDRSGTLWIGTHGGGLTRYQNGQFTHFSTEQGLSDAHIKCLVEDFRGNLWIGTDGGGLNLFRDGKFTVYSTADGLPDNRIGAIAEDNEGNLWIGTAGGLVLLEREKGKKGERENDGNQTDFSPSPLLPFSPSVFTTRDGLAGNSIRALFFDRDGNLWIGGADGLSRFRDGQFTTFGETDGLKKFEIRAIAQDRDGTLWIGTIEGGLYRLTNGRFEASTTQNGLINDEIQAVYPDQNGDIWLGTSGGGLAQLRTGRFSVFTRADGLPSDMIGAIFEDAAGGVWVGTDEGLSRFKDGKFTVITAPDGQPFKGVNDISQDRGGNIWITSSAGDKVLKFREESSAVEIVRDNVFKNRAAVILPDRNGNVWFGTPYDGLHLLRGDGSTADFHKQDGLADEYVNVLYEDRESSLWIGTRRGLSLFKDGNLTTWTADDGFTGTHVLSFHEDFRGNLWIGTHGDGLFRFRDGKFTRFTAKDGLYDNLAFQILEDAGGNLWMSGNKGIYRSNIAELEDFAAGRRLSINSFSYGSADGMLSRECNGANPAGIRASDGRLWFPTIKGVVVINPNKLDERQPVVALEQVSVDNKILPAGAAVEMQPAQENLEIQFTALSWSRPQQIRFKYRLVGLDEDWVESGTRRTAYFAHLPPGEYIFKVIADNGEGIWNTEGQSLRIVVLPPFYRTWWFWVLCVLAIILIIRLFYGYRLAQLEKINAAKSAFTQKLIEQQESERRRIALELHDSIGQSLSVIRNRALMSLSTPDKHEKIIAQMEEISEAAADSIAEVRQISHNLHPYQLEHLGLTTALETMIEAAEISSKIKFETQIEDVDDALSKEAEINLYRIVQECLNNILKHSGATKAGVSLKKDGEIVNLRIEDNGVGFDAENSFEPKGGLGLTGIAERAKMLNAQYKINSIPNSGTIISLQIFVD